MPRQTFNTNGRPVRRSPLRRSSASARSGFTLIELLLVLVILSVLAAIVVPKFTGRSEQARETAAKTDISAFEGALDAFNVDNGRYPSSQEGLRALAEQPGNVRNWRGPYIKQVKTDPWGNDYIYQFPGSHNPKGFDIHSKGADAQDGTGDDVDNWSNQ